MKLLHLLLLLIMSFASCKGQSDNGTKSREVTSIQKTIPGRTTKLAKTIGTNQNAKVHCGLVDKAGNLWFGTTGEGVYRYDGSHFTQFTTKEGLTHNFVWSIMEDNDGIIWFGTTNGICKYDGNSITNLAIPKEIFQNKSANTYYNDWSTKNTVWSIMQDKSGMLWIGTGDGMYCYDGKSYSRFSG